MGFICIKNTKDFDSKNLITYVVLQGNNILTIGSGEGKRLKTLMGNKGSHNKAPLIGLCHKIFKGVPLEFYLGRYTCGSGKFSQEERSLQSIYGETVIDGYRGYKAAMSYLRSKLNISNDSVESILLDLMETHGDILNHSLSTLSTAEITERIFDGYWKKSKKL